MILLIAFAFVAGIVTILSPCILPILPIILSSSVDTTGKKRPLGVVIGFILSFTFFTLFLSTIVKLSGIPAESLRYLSVFILIIFGLSLFVPKIQIFIERIFSKLTQFAPQGQNKHGFFGGIMVGLSLGLLWTPCVGPILASVISLALSGSVTTQAFIITLAYSLGTAIPMFIIMQAGSSALQKIPWLLQNSGNIQKIFGILMVITAIGIFFNVDRQFQAYILNTFPNYGVGLTKFEDNEAVKKQLNNMNDSKVNKDDIGKPTSDLTTKGPLALEIVSGGVWFNSDSLTLKKLRGKVVVIDFWTYSCINCQRTLPYLKDWHDKYKGKGLVIIGVHSPEFEFEKNEKNVARAIKDFQLSYPIVQDNNFATWRAYNNLYWPAKYIIDKDGYIRYTHFGEGAYDETERVIQELLKEAGEDVSTTINNPKYKLNSQTPETYLGSERMEYYYPSGKVSNGKQVFILSNSIPQKSFSFGGEWEIKNEYAVAGKKATLAYNFTADKVFLVLRAGKSNITACNPGQVCKTSAQIQISIDGKLVDSSSAGSDVQDGIVTIDDDRLYQLIDLKGKNGNHILKLEFQSLGIEAFAFTFG